MDHWSSLEIVNECMKEEGRERGEGGKQRKRIYYSICIAKGGLMAQRLKYK